MFYIYVSSVGEYVFLLFSDLQKNARFNVHFYLAFEKKGKKVVDKSLVPNRSK